MNGGNGNAPGEGKAAARPCAICGRPATDARLRPFCSKRCADVDLHRWLAESYRIPIADEGDTEDSDEDAGDGEGDEDEGRR